jgi:hypothetical protein
MGANFLPDAAREAAAWRVAHPEPRGTLNTVRRLGAVWKIAAPSRLRSKWHISTAVWPLSESKRSTTSR